MDAEATSDPGRTRLPQLQRAVQHKLGGCLLRLQQYELLLKAMVASTEMAGEPAKLQALRDEQIAGVQKATLGGLVSLLTGNYLSPEDGSASEEPDSAEPTDNTLWFSFRQRMVMSADHYEAIKAKLKELVDVRNDLVHHLLERFDLGLLDRCEAAVDYLDQRRVTIDTHYQTLRTWAEQMDQVRALAASFMDSPAFKDFLIDGIAPDGQVHWPISGIVSSLRGAEQGVAPSRGAGSWVELNAAIAWIGKHHPTQTPKRYGCNSWRQVLHECRLFEVKKQSPTSGIDLTKGMVVYYRSRREK
ncbi:OST-HTH/LOTUS domain-containing protein [Variovorax sp. dw_954]|uniref:OST-HTH/LOTUS domain-containing protein n=1 Tax=Variovorax sp. dw_954 TaxID=2720078 RepID=UPI001BD696C8|nr:OST-HTH/LOTUS domain-containing protein [Variovorax sp. dw_954]